MSKSGRVIFNVDDGEVNVKACWPEDDSEEALVEIRKKGRFYKKFKCPAGKICKVVAQFRKIINVEFKVR